MDITATNNSNSSTVESAHSVEHSPHKSLSSEPSSLTSPMKENTKTPHIGNGDSISFEPELSHNEKPVELINDDMLEKALEQANKVLGNNHTKIERSVHDVTKAVMYTLKDTNTDEVIKEFPPKKIQDMIAKMWEIAGLIVDKKA